ncbi:MAG: MoaD family protein [Pseudomonadota bacterium]
MTKKTITVQVDFYAGVQAVFGTASTRATLAGSSRTVGAALEAIAATRERRETIFDPAGGLRRDLTVFKNGRNIKFIGGLEAELNEGDVLALFPPTFGG